MLPPHNVNSYFTLIALKRHIRRLLLGQSSKGKGCGNVDDVEEGPLFQHGRDNDFSSLRLRDQVNDGSANPPSGGRVIRVPEMSFVDEIKPPELSDHNVGESLDDE